MAYKTLMWPLTHSVPATLFLTGVFLRWDFCLCCYLWHRGSLTAPRYLEQLTPSPSGLCSQQGFPSTIL